MIVVVVDTTATFVDVMMSSTGWMQMLTLANQSKVTLVVPDVVLRETVRHWHQQATEAVKIANSRIDKLETSKERLTHLGVKAGGIQSSAAVTDEPEAAAFEVSRRKQFEALGVDVRAVPADLDVETVLKRDLARKKPFQSSGKGFRDTLVWETLKEVVDETSVGDEIFFVTDNDADYCDAEGQIAPELLSELKPGTGHLNRAKAVDELLDGPLLSPLVATIAKTDDELADFLAGAQSSTAIPTGAPPVGEVVASAVQNSVEQLAGEEVDPYNNDDYTPGHNFSGLDLPLGLTDVTVDVVEVDETSLTWQTYDTYDDTTVLIQAEIDADISLIGLASKGEAVHLAAEGLAAVTDPDFNDHVAEVALSRSGRLIFQLLVEHGMNYAESCELEGVEPLLI